MTFDQMPSYPIAIQKAIMAVHCLEFFKQFTGATKSILMEIVIRLNQYDIETPIWFRRNTVAAKLHYDRKTIYNGLKKLEDSGLIQRQEQELDASGFFKCAKIIATIKLAELTGILFNPSDRGEKVELPTYNRKNSLKKQPEQHSFSENQKRPQELFDDPALKSLKDAGLSKPAIYLLMKICKSVNQRLSDVVNYIGDRLKQIKTPREIFAYLKRCIEADKDYSYMLERKTVEATKAAEQKEASAKLDAEMKAFRVKYYIRHFKSLKTGDIFKCTAEGCGHNIVRNAYLSPYEFYKAYINGQLVPVGIDEDKKLNHII